MKIPSRLALGTVQFGLAYGITNSHGQVQPEEARRILDLAASAGIGVLDTAAAYGESESALGNLGDAIQPFQIVTKTVPLHADSIGPAEAESVREGLERSRRQLRRDTLDAVLVHHSRDLLNPGGERVLDVLRDARAAGHIGAIGVSVYDPEEMARVLDLFTPDVVQLPFNLLDQRFAISGMLTRLKDLRVEIHARSLFLQGTLLCEADALPHRLAYAQPAFARVSQFLAAHRMPRLEACLGCGLAQAELDHLVIGVARADELAQIVGAVECLPSALPDFRPLAIDDENIVNPGKWRLESP